MPGSGFGCSPSPRPHRPLPRRVPRAARREAASSLGRAGRCWKAALPCSTAASASQRFAASGCECARVYTSIHACARMYVCVRVRAGGGYVGACTHVRGWVRACDFVGVHGCVHVIPLFPKWWLQLPGTTGPVYPPPWSWSRALELAGLGMGKKKQRDRNVGLSGNASLHRGWMLPIRVPMVSWLPGRTLAPAALDAQREPRSGEGPGQTPLPLRAGERAHDAFRHRHGARPRREAEKLGGGGTYTGAWLGAGGWGGGVVRPGCLPPPWAPAPLLDPRHPAPGPIVRPRRSAGQDSFVRARQYFILTINQTHPGPRACL